MRPGQADGTPSAVAAPVAAVSPERELRTDPIALRHELWRKALHLTSAAVPLGYAVGVPREMVLAALVLASAIAVVVELLRRHARRARHAFTTVTGSLLRAHEHDRWTGATWMLLSYALVVWLAAPAAAIAAMWAVSVGDALAAIVGRTWGRRDRARPGGKSILGSAACFAGTVTGALVVAGLGPAASLVAGTAASAAEWPTTPVDDNLRIAVAVAGAVTIAQWALALT